MSTRGFLGFVIDGRELITYNHNDSYPAGLGSAVLEWARNADMVDAIEKARDLRLVFSSSEPTDADIEALAPYRLSLNEPSHRPDWYELLRGTQGDPAAILAAGVLENERFLPCDPSAAWGYVIDFDKRAFEVYLGRQRKAHTKGRFAGMTHTRRGFFPARLVASWPLSDLPSDSDFASATLKAEVGL